MKKEYKKPLVMFEEIAFDTAIADACTYQVIGSVNHGDETLCEPVISYPDLGKVYVLNGFLECTDGAAYCYHNPTTVVSVHGRS